jgi:hypothetical protein
MKFDLKYYLKSNYYIKSCYITYFIIFWKICDDWKYKKKFIKKIHLL